MPKEEPKTKKKLLTPKEKFVRMNKKNELLLSLKKEFNLDLLV